MGILCGNVRNVFRSVSKHLLLNVKRPDGKGTTINKRESYVFCSLLCSFGVNASSDDSLLACRSHSQASSPRSVTSPQLPSPSKLDRRHLVYCLSFKFRFRTGDWLPNGSGTPQVHAHVGRTHEPEDGIARLQMESQPPSRLRQSLSDRIHRHL